MCTDYQIWKAANLINPTYFNLFEVGLALGCTDIKIKTIVSDLEVKFLDSLNSKQTFRMSLYNILLLQRNKTTEKEFIASIVEVYSDLGYERKVKEIFDIKK